MRRMMFTSAIVAILLATFSFAAAADDPFEIGFKGGGNASNFRGAFATLAKTEYKAGYVGGMWVGYSLRPNIALQSEVLYTQKGAKTTRTLMEEDGSAFATQEVFIEIDYVEVPVLARVNIARIKDAIPYVIAGPAFAFPVMGRVRTEEPFVSETVVPKLQRTDVGVVIGAGMSFGATNAKFMLEGRYTAGLKDLYDVTPNAESVSGVYSFMAGVSIRPDLNFKCWR